MSGCNLVVKMVTTVAKGYSVLSFVLHHWKEYVFLALCYKSGWWKAR